MRVFLLFLLFISLINPCAHSTEIKGRVVDSNGKGIPSVSILTESRSVGTTTDSEGYFVFLINDEIKRITISSVGYQARQLSVTDLPENIRLETRFYRGTDI